MWQLRSVGFVLICLLLSACGGGGGTRPNPPPVPSKTCSERLGTGVFVTSTVANPSVTDSTCPSGSTLTTSGISNTTTTTSYSCPSPSSISDPVASSTISAPIVTQTKVCSVAPPALTCSQKLGTGGFVTTTSVSTNTDNVCPSGQNIVQNGLSQMTTTTSYSCVNPASTDDPISTITTSGLVATQPKVCNLAAPINYSTYFRDKTGVIQANAAGFTGAGVKIAIYDNGFNVNNAALAGRVSTTFGDLTDDDPDLTSHGTSVAAIAAGRAWGDYPGGVAPDATLALADWDSNIYSIINWGAKVFNFSFGYGYDEDDPSKSAPDANDASSSDVTRYVSPWLDEMRAIRDAGAFLVISAGNDGEQANYDSAGILAAAPAFYTDLNNIVAVVAMSPLNGTKAGYSNPCGAIAMNFCLAAPGTVNLLLPTVTQTDPLTADSYKWFAGTSAAAPVVSGIAALVYQAFPGFNGNQVQQTLLTTATDLGALGVDPIYGWGYVNAQKAVLGPAKLSSSFMAVVPDNVTWNFGNDIIGDGSIVKDGGGGLTLSGNNTYTGGTEIQAGQLNLLGQVTGDVRLNGGTLLAAGKVLGSVQANAGTLLLSSKQVFQVQGDLQLAGSSLQLNLPTGYFSQWQGILVNANNISGSSSLLAPSSWFVATSSINSQQISASLQRKSVTDVLSNSSATEQNTASNLEVAFQKLDAGQGSDALKQSAALLQATTKQQAKMAFNSLSGQSQTTTKDIALETSDALQPLLTERLFDLARLQDTSSGAWIMFASPNGSKDSSGFIPVDISTNLIAAGIDHQWDKLILGAALFSADDNAKFDGVQDFLKSDRQGISLYGRHQGEYGFVQGFAFLSNYNQRLSRTITVGQVSSLANSNSDGTSQGLSIEAGKALNNQWTLALQASADWVETDAFKESGSTGLELQFESSDLTRYLLGPDIRYQSAIGKGFSWSAQLGYRYVLNDVDTSMQAAYAGLPNSYFTVIGMPYSQDFFNAALGLGYQTQKAYWYLRGDLQDADNAERTTLSAGVRIGF
jgi:autotransporter-associated beta strand protein